ncbi:VanZ family protein [Streptomyces sp. SL13]|uniref:VanZ family protein n=1 Tax=Streptantibioticus silvisoli TaxID=2705255 RepID=A0AA90HBP9_9ACTN|nr:VanZ family protein [Streptantibioticus silvisoli]MDI5973864.1 VanZ family protein [Streptantibioticus silvisoli]
MLTAVFRGHETFVIFGVLISLVVGFATYKIARSRGGANIAAPIWAAGVAAVILLTSWSTGGTAGPSTCVINRDLAEPFLGEQGLLNLAMFVPLGFVGVIATGRFLLPVCSMVLLSFGIETAQGLFPALGRACDTSDLEMNGIGVVVGALFGAVLLQLWRKSRRTSSVRSKTNWVVGGSYVLIGVIALIWIKPNAMDRTQDISTASSQQTQVADRVLRQAFDGHYHLRAVDFAHGPDGTGTVTALFAGGSIEITWPGAQQATASLDPLNGQGYPVPGRPQHASTSSEARRIAISYAQVHAPWALTDSVVTTSPVGQHAERGWIVSWRRHREDVLMPMRLDIQIERTGRLSAFIMRKIADPPLPPTHVTRQNAILAARSHSPGGAQAHLQGATLLAKQSKGRWIVQWLVALETPDQDVTAYVDAYSDKVLSVSRVLKVATGHS